MGLDLEPLGKAKPGFESEWEALMAPLYADKTVPQAEHDRRNEISVMPYADIGAPQVGGDPEADQWIIAKARQAGDARPDAQIIANMTGYYAVELLRGKSDGVPAYSNSPLGYVEATSFRGEFLKDCTAFLDQVTIALAWRTVIPPSEAVRYGDLLLANLDRPPDDPFADPNIPNWVRRILRNPATSSASVQEQRQIIDAAGRWYKFWGGRGNPIWANY